MLDSSESVRSSDYGRPPPTPCPPLLNRADEVYGKGSGAGAGPVVVLVEGDVTNEEERPS